MLARRLFALALTLALQGRVGVWCLVCGELIDQGCVCLEACVCECDECVGRPFHLEADHADC